MSLPKIFISMGTPYNENASRFRDALESFLRDQCQTDPRIIGKNEYPDGNPLTKIREVMSGCHGVIVVAYERKYLRDGVEKRSSESPTALSDRAYTTPWNHIESAMAFSLDLPLYILCQKGLTEEGMIESKLDWYVQHIELDPQVLATPSVSQSLKTWIEARVVPKSRAPRLVRAMQGSMRLSEMTPREVITAVGVIVASFSAGVALAGVFPKIFG
jgi:hypothetical protein